MVSDIILSICIPTYNRCTYLDKCIASIVKQAGNNQAVEVLISDNASEDNTKEMVESYIRQYENVKYFRNETNIGGDKNFIRALQMGEGKYLKLLNDYVEFKDGGVLKMLEIVKRQLESKEIIYFVNGVSYLKRKEYYYSKNINEFISVCSFWSTLIGTIGFWKEDFDSMLNNYYFKTNNFLHTELLFENFNAGKGAITYTKQIYTSNEVLNKKTGYNFFEVFIDNYFNQIIGNLYKNNCISFTTYLKEKNRLFTDFIFVWYKRIKIKKGHSVNIIDKGMESLVFKNYKYNPVFYLYLLYLPFYLLGFYIKKTVIGTKKTGSKKLFFL